MFFAQAKVETGGAGAGVVPVYPSWGLLPAQRAAPSLSADPEALGRIHCCVKTGKLIFRARIAGECSRAMANRSIKTLSPTRSFEITEAMLKALWALLTAKDQNEAARAVSNLIKAAPELQDISELNGALIAGYAKALADSDAPLTPERFTFYFQNSGLSQARLAEILQVTQSNISEWPKGARPIPQKHAKKFYETCADEIAKRAFGAGSSTSENSQKNQSAA
jgi:DNA-binding transcriptional regulator YiaG